MGCRQSRLYYVDDSVKVLKKKDEQRASQHQMEQTMNNNNSQDSQDPNGSDGVGPTEPTDSTTQHNKDVAITE